MKEKTLARRELIGAGALGATYLLLPEGCGSVSADRADAGPPDSSTPDATREDGSESDTGADVEPEATLVEGGGDCTQDDWTHPISIAAAGIAAKGTAYAFADPRFSDATGFGEDRILLIHPLTGSGYVAMSGVCTHMGCCPSYFARCAYGALDGGTPGCESSDAGVDGEQDAGLDAEVGSASDAGAVESGSESDAGAAADAETDGGTTLLTDVLVCPCHGSVFDAKTGKAINGPAMVTGNLQIMKTCVGGGYVFVTIPNNGFGTGGPPDCPTP